MDHNNTGQKNMIKQTLWKPGGTILEKDLKMEVFASVDTVKPVEFHVYELHAQKIGNTYSYQRGSLEITKLESGRRIWRWKQNLCDGKTARENPKCWFYSRIWGITRTACFRKQKNLSGTYQILDHTKTIPNFNFWKIQKIFL